MSWRVRPCLFVLPLLVLSVPSLAQVAWVRKYDDALKQAADQKKFVVLDISASWCPYCRKMAREVYPNKEFIDFSRAHVFMRLFLDTDAEGRRLGRRFNVRGFPTIVVLNVKGEEVGRLVGARGTRKLIRDLEEIFDESSLYGDAQNEAPEPVQPERESTPAPVKAAPASNPSPKPAAESAPVKTEPKDLIANLEKKLASAQDGSEKNWLTLMLALAHFESQHWKEARVYVGRVLEKEPDNPGARELMKALDKMERP